MGTKRNPADNDCYARALPDEPMFILLARDASAPGIVQTWATYRLAQMGAGLRSIEEDMPVVREAQQCAKAMEAWRDANRETRDNAAAWKRPNRDTHYREYVSEARSLLQVALKDRLPAIAEAFGERDDALSVNELNAVEALAFLLERADYPNDCTDDKQLRAKV